MSSRRFRTPALHVLSATLFILLVATCGDDGNGGVGPGGNLPSTFSAAVTGGSAGSYSGLSTAAAASGLFAIGLNTPDGKFLLSFSRSGPRPVDGSFPLGANPRAGFTASLNVGPGQAVYTSIGGTLTITESSATSVKGTFSFVTAVSAGVGPAASVSGSFSAVCPSSC
jgi:hypothetical protein